MKSLKDDKLLEELESGLENGPSDELLARYLPWAQEYLDMMQDSTDRSAHSTASTDCQTDHQTMH